MDEEVELRMACMESASTLDNDSVEQMIAHAEALYLWVTDSAPDSKIEVDNKGRLNMNPNDN